MKKIGIYGGSFNPVHFGHIGLAWWTLTHTDLDELWMMVTPGNPLKDGFLLQQNEQERLQQTRQAVEQALAQKPLPEGKMLRVSDFEYALPRPTYTAATLRALQQTYPDTEWTLLIGEDNLQLFDRWREWEWIAEHFRILVYPRRCASANTCKTLAFPHAKEVTYLTQAPLFDISSTEIRDKGKKNLHIP